MKTTTFTGMIKIRYDNNIPANILRSLRGPRVARRQQPCQISQNEKLKSEKNMVI